jgi:glycosyltransferase involved in cell wall biosynthesis
MTNHLEPASALTIGMLSTYPPTKCGLATFSSALERALITLGHRVRIVHVEDSPSSPPVGRPVAGVLTNGSPASARRSAAVLSKCDVAIIQHEYGIFGGPDGEDVIDVITDIDAPTIAVLHTVPQSASVHQAELLVELCAKVDRVVVMSESARERLVATYFPIDDAKVVTIPHGATLARHVLDGSRPNANPRAQLLTWGLIGPGKGIEHVIDALGLLHGLGQSVTYTIAGATHPKVLAREGNHYRNGLRSRAKALGVDHLVTFDDAYRGVRELTEFIASAGTVVLPYDTVEQATSGVLVDSIAGGRAVIATRFPHAEEMLSAGAGLLVPHRDPKSLAVAIRTVTTEPALLEGMRAEARAMAPLLSWDSVASEYTVQAEALLRAGDRFPKRRHATEHQVGARPE